MYLQLTRCKQVFRCFLEQNCYFSKDSVVRGEEDIIFLVRVVQLFGCYFSRFSHPKFCRVVRHLKLLNAFAVCIRVNVDRYLMGMYTLGFDTDIFENKRAVLNARKSLLHFKNFVLVGMYLYVVFFNAHRYIIFYLSWTQK